MSRLFPAKVDIDERAVAELAREFRQTQKQIRSILLGLAAKGITAYTVQQARADIQHVVDQTGGRVGAWIDRQVPASYQRGQNDVVAQLNSKESSEDKAAAAAIAAGAYAFLHSMATDAFKQDMSTRLSTALTQMRSSSDYIMNQALHQSLRDKMAGVKGQSVAKLRQSVLDELNDQGINALIDKAGKRWQPDTYADNLARTYLMQAHNAAVTNSLKTQGQDLVVVSSHGAKDACGPWEGQTLSIDGSTPDYPTVSDATAAGLFHNNCKHNLFPA